MNAALDISQGYSKRVYEKISEAFEKNEKSINRMVQDMYIYKSKSNGSFHSYFSVEKE